MPEDSVGSPQWGSAEDIRRIFGITRGTLYKLAKANRIKSTVFKTKEDARKGVRLFSIQSIREFLEANVISF
jgi:helix-turn-helix protein